MTDAIGDRFKLSISRHIKAPPETVWKIMTQRMAEWWCPKPWRAKIISQDWRPGGPSKLRMIGPEGESFEADGIFLEIVPGQKFVTTDAVSSDLLPATPFMIGCWEIAPDDGGTRYTATAFHWTQDGLEQHQQMGFETGWTAAADQLAELCMKFEEKVE